MTLQVNKLVIGTHSTSKFITRLTINQTRSIYSCQVRRSISNQAQGSSSSEIYSPKSPPIIYGVTYVPPLQSTRYHTKGGDNGLYDGLKVRAGDNISKSKHRTKRTWKPNIQKTKLWSEVLGQSLQLRVTCAALKTIDQVGGLDRYVLQMSEKRLGGMGIRIRDLVIAAMKEKVRLSKAFTQPIAAEESWRIPQWQDSSKRIDQISVRKMVPSVDVKQVTVFPRKLLPERPAVPDPLVFNDFFVRGKKGSVFQRRSTHPRRSTHIQR